LEFGSFGNLKERMNDDFNLDGQDTKVWLVKVPKFLAEKWAEINTEPGVELGVIRIHDS
jgi:transcription initiation factor TFIIF subunit beta